MIKLKIDGNEVFAKEGETILQVATREGIFIPTLCYLKEVEATSNCRICLVEVVGQKNLVTACSYKVFDGMEIRTNSAKIFAARKMNLELILSNHNYDCANCIRGGQCDLANLAMIYGANEKTFMGDKTNAGQDFSSPCIVRDGSKCILCKKCVQVCEKVQTVSAIGAAERGFSTRITTPFDAGFAASTCVGCGQCVLACPTGALSENPNLTKVEKLLKDKNKLKIVAPAPAVRAALLESFGLEASSAERIIPSLFRAIGFDKVFDINFGADLTIVEEAAEFESRLKSGKDLPMFTSCCPAWVEFSNKFYPALNRNVSSCKSPLMMFGAVAKTYYAEKVNISSENISVVSVMPCTAKKGEIHKFEKNDVDCIITVRELIHLIHKNRIDVSKLQPSAFDSLLGESSGAGVIFGVSGGVMEAAIRTLADKVYKKDIEVVEYSTIRGLDGTKMATIELGEKQINIAVVSGLGNARKLIEKIKNKEINLHFVEVMACPGGCINGGGMPRTKSANTIEARMQGLYNIDKARINRKSHKNKEILEFLKWQKTAKNKAQLHTREK